MGGGLGVGTAVFPTCPNLGSSYSTRLRRPPTSTSSSTSTSTSTKKVEQSLRIFDGSRTTRRTPGDIRFGASSCLPPSSPYPKTKLFVSGLSFNTTEESLRNAFEDFGNLLQFDLVMDKISNRPRGFAFVRYATEEESQNAIKGMHGKFLDGRVIFVEIAKPRSELSRGSRQNRRQF